jgi:hypothetical protein
MISKIAARTRHAQGMTRPENPNDHLPSRPSTKTQPHKQRAEERIANALGIVAILLEHDDAYLPIFLRLEAELQASDKRKAALARARAFLKVQA